MHAAEVTHPHHAHTCAQDIMERGEQAVTDKLTELHGEHVGLSCDQAEDKFLQRAMSLENYGKIAYDVTRVS